jgi:signal transduction histidine kinase
MPRTLKLNDVDSLLGQVTREGVFRIRNWRELVYANTAFLRLLGYTSIYEYNALQRSIFVNDEDVIMIRTSIAAGEAVMDRRVLLKTRNNGNFWASISCIPEDEQCIVGAIMDITSLVENEHTLRLNANALAKSNMELDRFIYSASHDIRSPISTVMGLINLINLEKDHVRQMELIGMIGSTMVKLDTFLHQLSSHSKNARRDIEVSKIDVGEAVTMALEQLSDHPRFAEVDVQTKLEIDGTFFSDRERLGTVLLAVLRNAYDFMDATKPKKQIDVLIQFIRNKLIVEIFDNGIGINESRVSNVFDLFYKASSQSRGAGLGLYLVRETTTRLGGVVTLHSRLGVGTLVRLEIPNARVAY